MFALSISSLLHDEITEEPGQPAFAKTRQLIPGRLDCFVRRSYTSLLPSEMKNDP